MNKDYSQGVPPLHPQQKDGETITAEYTPIEIEKMKNLLQKFGNSIDSNTTKVAVQNAVAIIEWLQAESDRLRKENLRLQIEMTRKDFDAKLREHDHKFDMAIRDLHAQAATLTRSPILAETFEYIRLLEKANQELANAALERSH